MDGMTELEIFTGKHAAPNVLALGLLDVIAEVARGQDDPRAAAFLQRLERHRGRLAATTDPAQQEFAVRECVDLCEAYFAEARNSLAEREAEFAALIDLLREGLSKVAGGATSFNGWLLGSSERFRQLSGITDLREMRRQLSLEVTVLQQAITEKQQQDEAHAQELSKQIAKLEATVVQARLEALEDPLTRVANRRQFDQTLYRWATLASRHEAPFALAMIDLDNFKRFNDQHGHQVGDRVLLCAAQHLRQGVTTHDLVSRYGGEEFAILLANADADSAEKTMARILARAASTPYEYDQEERRVTVRFTMSCGVTEFTAGETPVELVARADRALRDAKKRGKNRVVVKRPSRLRGLVGVGR